MVSMKFHLRISGRKEGRHAGRLYLRVIYKRIVRNIATPFYLYSEEWDAVGESVIYPVGDNRRMGYVKKVEKELESVRGYLYRVIERLEEEGDFSALDIVNAYRRRLGGNSLSSFVEKLTKELCCKGQERTARAYRTALNGFIQFCGEGKSFEQLNSSLMVRYEGDMKAKGLSLNTISFYMRNLRAIYNKAIRERVFDPKVSNPFEGVYTGVQQTRKRALSKAELSAIIEDEETCSLTPELQMSKDLFAFSFYARGISFVDLAYLKKDDICDGVLSYYRKKTGSFLEVKLTPEMKHIIRSYESETKDSIYLFPIIKRIDVSERLQYESALRVQNNRLKKLASLYDIKKDLTTHVARHTWATVAKGENLPLSVISESLGHTSEKTTSIYLASFDQSVLDQANKKVMKAIRQAV